MMTYRLADGRALPRVSDIVAELATDDGLLDWIAHTGPRWREERQRYADRGTEVHALVEGYLRHGVVSSSLATEDALNRVDLFRAWWQRRAAKTEIVLVEEPIVSAALGYGGTPDLLVRVKGRLEVWDIKTSSSVRESHWVQVAAYCALASERLGEPVAHGAILRLLKDGPTLSRSKEMTPYARVFGALHAVHLARRSIAQVSDDDTDKERGVAA